jgi:hypothetical protein
LGTQKSLSARVRHSSPIIDMPVQPMHFSSQPIGRFHHDNNIFNILP